MKRRFLILVMFIALISTGCSEMGRRDAERSPGVNNQPGIQNEEAEDKGNQSESFKTVTPSAALDLNLEQIQGKIKNIDYADDGYMLVTADKLYLFDLASGKVVTSAAMEAMENMRYWRIENGYAVIGSVPYENIGSAGSSGGGLGFTVIDSGPQYQGVFYDQKLNKTSEFNFSVLLDKGDYLLSIQAISFSTDGTRVAYATSSGLYLYDFQQDKRTTVIDLTTKDATARLGLVALEQIGFTNDNKSIAFKAQSFDIPHATGKSSFDTCGMVNTDGSGLSNQKNDGYAIKELTVYDIKLLVAEDFTTATGRMMVMESPSGKTKIHSLTEKNEGGNIYGSDSGRYFASSVSNKTGWIIRVYDTENGKLLSEQLVSNDGQALYGMNDPILRVLDDTRTCVVLLGTRQDTIETKITTFAF